jgi:hypothetical protein
MALLPLRRKACWGYFCPEKSWRLRPSLNPRTWVLKGSMLTLDHPSSLLDSLKWGQVKNFTWNGCRCTALEESNFKYAKLSCIAV